MVSIMFTAIQDRNPLSDVAAFFFTRQKGYKTAKRHPSLVSSLHIWHVRRAAVAELERLSDRTLADIGVARGEIPGIVASRV
jgi:uncharacterized protein YjiS (DUF1127 family)